MTRARQAPGLPPINVDFATATDPVDEVLDAILGPGPGHLVLGCVRGPKIDGYKRPFEEQAYRWPEQRDEARAEIDRRNRERWDVYFCSALQVGPKRDRHTAASIRALSFELDDEPADPALLEKLDALIVESGTPGHVHVHVLVDQDIDVETADRLTETIARAVGKPGKGVAFKWEANAYLRPPGTRNFKTYWAKSLPMQRSVGGAARRVRIKKGEGKRWSLDELEALCASLTPRTTPSERRRAKPVLDAQLTADDDLGEYPTLFEALKAWEGTVEGRRNDAHHAITRECYKARLTEESAVALLLKQPWCKWDEHGVEADVRREYNKAAEEGLAQIPGAEFWSRRAWLQHIYDYAYERMVSPWSMLAVVLARVGQTIPSYKVLPELIGGPSGLNLALALLSETGGGKSSSADAGERAIIIPGVGEENPIGTGPGMTRPYARSGKGGVPDPIAEAALFTSDEVFSFQQELSRPGSNLMGQISTAWSSGAIGATNKRDENNLTIPKHTYRFAIYVGVQPELSDAMLAPDRRHSGFASRWLWFDADLPEDAVAIYEYKAQPKAWHPPHSVDTDKVMKFTQARPPEQLEFIKVPLAIWKIVKEARLERRRAPGLSLTRKEHEKLESHAKLNHLKVAAHLMWLDGREDEINDEDWDLAGQIMAHSVHMRARAIRTYDIEQGRKHQKQAHQAGKNAVISEHARETELVKKAKARIRTVLERGPLAKSYLVKSKMTVSLRGDVAEQALQEMVDDRAVRVTKKVDPKTRTETLYYRLPKLNPGD